MNENLFRYVHKLLVDNRKNKLENVKDILIELCVKKIHPFICVWFVIQMYAKFYPTYFECLFTFSDNNAVPYNCVYPPVPTHFSSNHWFCPKITFQCQFECFKANTVNRLRIFASLSCDRKTNIYSSYSYKTMLAHNSCLQEVYYIFAQILINVLNADSVI